MSLDPMPDAATLLRMKAEREGKRMLGMPVLTDSRMPQGYVAMVAPGQPPVVVRLALSTVTLRLPWTCLVSDNEKFVAFMRAGKPAIKIRREYASARERIAGFARDQMGEAKPFDVPLSLTARVWYPNKAGRDLTNWCKLVHDALNGVVYTDDALLRDVRWLYGGVDIDAPRCDLTITPLAA